MAEKEKNDDINVGTTKKSLIERIDGSLLEVHKRWTVKWMDRTHKSKSDLEKELYYGSGAVFGAGAFLGDILMVPLAFFSAGFGALEYSRPRSPEYKKKQWESDRKLFTNARIDERLLEEIGVGKTMPKYSKQSKAQLWFNIGVYGLGVINAALGAGYFVSGVITKNHETCKTGLQNVALGTGIIGMMGGNYVSRVDLDPEPKKIIDDTIFRYK